MAWKIPGITTQVRYTRLGKIRLGEKVESKRPGGQPYPKATDHFVFVDAPAVEAVYKGNCTMIAPVFVPGNPKREGDEWDFSSFWKTSRSAYGRSTGLFCRSIDGETATRVHMGIVDDPKNTKRHGKPADPQGFAYIQEKKLEVDPGEMFDMPCPGEACPYFENKMCKNLGVLDLMLPKVPGFGVWTVQTSSFHSIRNIHSMLVMLADALGGQLGGIPLGLALKPQQVQVEGRAKTVFVLELHCPANLQQLAGLRRRALESSGAIAALIEGEVPPDEFFSEGGAALDKDLGKAEPPAPEDPSKAEADRARALGKQVGMTKAQVEAEIRRAGPEHLVDLIDDLERRLEARGGEVADAEIVEDAVVHDDDLPKKGGFTVDESRPMVEDPDNIFMKEPPPGYVPTGARKDKIETPQKPLMAPTTPEGRSPYDF